MESLIALFAWIMKFKCRIVSDTYHALNWPDYVISDVVFSARVPLEQADGLLALYDPTEELLRFPGPKMWFTQEPMCHSHFHRHPIGKRLAKTLRPDERGYFANPVIKYRIPQVTGREFTKIRQAKFENKAVATVNDCGGRFGWLKRNYSLRNKMVTCPLVDLFGSENRWREYACFPCIWKRGLPPNWRGTKAPGSDYHDPLFFQFLSGYKVFICLENSFEPYWFTEKMVNAARAGCIPVYHCHPTVGETFLRGAKWVDPSDFDFNPRRTIEHALSQNIDEFRAANDAWLDSVILTETTQERVLNKTFQIMAEKINHAKDGFHTSGR